MQLLTEIRIGGFGGQGVILAAEAGDANLGEGELVYPSLHVVTSGSA